MEWLRTGCILLYDSYIKNVKFVNTHRKCAARTGCPMFWQWAAYCAA